MTTRTFSQLLLLTTGVSLLLVFLLNLFFKMEDAWELPAVSILFFILLSLGVYILGVRAANNDNPNVLTRLMLAVIFIKLFSSVLVVVIYQKVFEPSSKNFIFLFIAVYICFSILETHCLSKLSKTNPRKG